MKKLCEACGVNDVPKGKRFCTPCVEIYEEVGHPLPKQCVFCDTPELKRVEHGLHYNESGGYVGPCTKETSK